MRRPFCVALTGGVGCGKSLVASVFSGLGVEVVDTDLIARELTAADGAAMARIGREFGPAFLAPDGSLDRRRMRDKVFAEPEARARLEGILHPLIRQRVAQALSSSQAPYVLLVVPLLVESGEYWKLADRTLVVDCMPDQQVERVVRRDGIAEANAKAVLAAQTSRERRLELADDVIDNRGDVAAVEPEVLRLHQLYLRLAGKSG